MLFFSYFVININYLTLKVADFYWFTDFKTKIFIKKINFKSKNVCQNMNTNDIFLITDKSSKRIFLDIL